MIIVPPVSPQASPAAQELGQKITVVIREYQQTHPGLPSTDIHQALRIARINSGAGLNPRFIILLAVGLLFAAGLLAFLLSSRPDGGGTDFPILHVFVAVVVLVLLGIAIVAKR